MKKSLRLPLSFLVLVAVFTLFTCRSVVLREGYISPESFQDHSVLQLNSSLIDLASTDPSEPALKKEVEDLLEGNFPNPRGRHRTISSIWRRDNHGIISDPRLRSAVKLPIRLRNPVDYRILPEFRRALRDWIRSRRFHPSVMSSLPDLVKVPLDRHFRSPARASLLYDSCAVVGNSGILLKSDHGDLIDSHHLVIRLNNARIQGYARHVGSKTNLSFVNSNILHLCARRDTCFCHPYGKNVPIIMYICQPVHFLDYATCNSSHESPLLVTDPRFDLLCARIVKYYSLKGFVEETRKAAAEWGKFHDEKMFHYSSGMQAVMLAVGICRKVSVFGFGKSTEAKHHYHTNQKAELDLHDYEAEYAFYRDLVDRPEVIPFLKDSGIKVPPIVFYH